MPELSYDDLIIVYGRWASVEMSLTLNDFMDRRAVLLLFSENLGLAATEPAADIMA